MSQSVENFLTSSENSIRKWWNVCVLIFLLFELILLSRSTYEIIQASLVSKSTEVSFSLRFKYIIEWVMLFFYVMTWYNAYYEQATRFFTVSYYFYGQIIVSSLSNLSIKHLSSQMTLSEISSIAYELVLISFLILIQFLSSNMIEINKKVRFQKKAPTVYQRGVEFLKASKNMIELEANYRTLKRRWRGWGLAFRWQYKLRIQELKGRAS